MAATTTMKAWGQTEFGGADKLKIVEIPKPTPGPRDLLIKVVATGVNPVDGKKREGNPGLGMQFEHALVLGWDGAGVVESVGDAVTLFKAGDEVYWSGAILRPGANAEYTLVDERIVGHKPKSLDFLQAAGEPLTILTAWEGMVEGMHIPVPSESNPNPNKDKVLLVISGAGGVGSIATQIGKSVLKFGKVIATATREETIEYCRRMGADEVISHAKDYQEEFKRIGVAGADYVMDCVDVDTNFVAVEKVIKPLGAICAITHAGTPVDTSVFFPRRISFVWELMFTRGLFDIEQEKQGQILNHFAGLIDSGIIKHRAETVFEWSRLPQAQEFQDSGKAKGKIVLAVNFA
eukprot:TRINITY_DN6298_c0_g1_i1.p1 TRINITY_DN6298_c0_g1~~TRINITY_DN6298_c0_g1_i1.p1  ORF type:complete len:367 (+),score=97.59 TRINITY_DN6298_c0_g1_i1:55-1101(+)